MVYRVFVEKKQGLDHEAASLCKEINTVLYGKLEAAIPMGAGLIEEYFSSLPALLKKRKMNDIFRYNYSGIKITEE